MDTSLDRYTGRIKGNCDIRLCKVVENIVNDGFANEETGDQETFNYYALVLHRNCAYIMESNNCGFVYVERYDLKEGIYIFEEIEKEYNTLMERENYDN